MPWSTPTNIGKQTETFGNVSFAVTTNVPPGSLIVVVVGTATTGTPLGAAVQDSQGNAYTLAKQVVNTNDCTASIYYAYNVVALTVLNGDTISFGDGDPDLIGAAISGMYVTGSGAVDPFDTASDNSATGSSTTPSVTSLSPVGSGELFVGLVTCPDTISGFSDDFDWTYFSVPAFEFVANIVLIPATTVNAGSGTQVYNPTLNDSAPWATVIASFKLPLTDPPGGLHWPNPMRRRVGLNPGHTDRFKLPLTTHRAPQQQFDWPNPRGPRPMRPDWSLPPTLLLDAPPPELPSSRQLDWPNPHGSKPLVQDWLQTSTLLGVAPPPVLPASRKLDWPNPVRARRPAVLDWIRPSTWLLTQPLPVIPMARGMRDWPVPKRRRGSINSFTNNTFLTPPLPQGGGEMLDNRTGRVRYVENEVRRTLWLAKN